jgi:hypothetical protein
MNHLTLLAPASGQKSIKYEVFLPKLPGPFVAQVLKIEKTDDC